MLPEASPLPLTQRWGVWVGNLRLFYTALVLILPSQHGIYTSLLQLYIEKEFLGSLELFFLYSQVTKII